MRILHKIIHVLALTVTIGCFIFGGLFLFLHVKGLEPFVIVSGSMEPTIPTGSMVLVDSSSKGSEKEGDITAYRLQDGPVVVHRLAEVTEEGNYLMKGDANNASDMEQISPDQVQGVVRHIVPKAGYAARYFIRTSGVPAGSILAVVAMVFLHLLDMIFAKITDGYDDCDDDAESEEEE